MFTPEHIVKEKAKKVKSFLTVIKFFVIIALRILKSEKFPAQKKIPVINSQTGKAYYLHIYYLFRPGIFFEQLRQFIPSLRAPGGRELPAEDC